MTVKDDVNGFLANSLINFRHIDQSIVRKYDADVLSKINSCFVWIEEERNIGKEIIRDETGRTRLPKTPKRGYCFSQEAETFQKCRKKLLDTITKREPAAFANDGNTAICVGQTPKSSRNGTARVVKQDTVLNGRLDDRKMPIRSLFPREQCTPKQKTPIKVNKCPPVKTSEYNTPKRTPLKNVVTPRITTQKFVTNTEVVVRKITVTPKITVDRINVTPKMTDKKNAATPKATTQQPTFKRSEVIRKMEKRTDTVIKNKEELMKEKAERARRDREERAMRVKMNNKKKEEETLEKLRIIKMREQQIEELRQKQRMPQRAISKSPCRTRGYYNRIQKPLVRAKSSQNISSAPKSVLQKAIAKDGQENLQIQGKRNRADSIKQNSEVHNKRQKLDLVECNERGDADRCSAVIDTPENDEFVDSQTHVESLENGDKRCSAMTETSENVLGDKFAEGQAYIECLESDEKKNSGERGDSRSMKYITNESEETSAVIEQGMLEHLQNSDISSQIVMHSSAVENLEINAKENMDGASHDIDFDISTVDASHMNNQTFDKSVNISVNKTSDSVGNNYDVESISSNDETDDEENPRKPIPFWAQGERLQNALRKQVVQPSIDPDAYFGPVRTPKLEKIFARNRTRYNKRTSSAVWTSPMSNPKKGTSKFFELQNANHGSKYHVTRNC